MKAYLYCMKAKPYLCINSGTFFGSNNPYELGGARENLSRHLNGTVCFVCEINKVEEIENTLLHMAPTFMHETKTLCDSELLRRACLTPEEADDYSPKYALYLDNVKKIDNPFTVITAPQNMCYMTMNGERCVLISIQSQHLCNVANGLKDIEVRKSILNKLKELIK